MIAQHFNLPYPRHMNREGAYLEVRIETDQPIELGDFVRAFSSYSKNYMRWVRLSHPEASDDAKIYLSKIREGSIIAELFPVLVPLISSADSYLIVKNFGEHIKDRIAPYFTKGGRADGANKSELKNLMDGVVAVANDPDGKASISEVQYHETKTSRKLLIQFDTKQAKDAMIELNGHYEELSAPQPELVKNTLLVFRQSNTDIKEIDKRTGDKGVIPAIEKDKPRPIVYASDLDRQRIKDAIIHDDENVYKRGFYVNVEVDRLDGRIAAYKILELVDIIDLDDD